MADIYDKVEKVEEYLRKAKIPNLPRQWRDNIERLINTNGTYQAVIDYAASVNESLNAAQVKRHRDMMPLIARLKPEATSYTSPQTKDLIAVPKEDYSAMKHLKEFLDKDFIRAIQESLQQDINEGRLNQTGMESKVNILDKVAKLSRIIGGESTENIQVQATVKTESHGKSLNDTELQQIEKINDLLTGGEKSEPNDQD